MTKLRREIGKGGVLARATLADFPTYIPSGKAAPFQMNFRFPDGTAPARLRFSYTYWLAEDPRLSEDTVDTKTSRISVISTHHCDVRVLTGVEG